MLSLFYLIVATIKEDFAIAPMFMVIADALNTLLFLVGGIALAAYLGVHSCGSEVSVGSRRKTYTTLTTGQRNTLPATKSRMVPIILERGVMKRKP